jgi:hypothetical protein
MSCASTVNLGLDRGRRDATLASGQSHRTQAIVSCESDRDVVARWPKGHCSADASIHTVGA